MLKGENIYLRGVEIEDLSFIERVENNPENWLVSGTLIPFSKKSIEEYVLAIRDLNSDKQCRFIISTIEEDESIGTIDLFEYDSINKRAGIGIIIEEKHRKMGYGSEALNVLCDYAFSYLNLHQIWANIIDSNLASQNLFENNDFKKTAVKFQWIQTNGKWYDAYFYQRINSKTI